MIVVLHNCAHNGDVLASSQIVKILVKSNPEIKFEIVPSCSSVLFEELVNENVKILHHPSPWVITINQKQTAETYLDTLSDVKINYKNNKLYINFWVFMTENSCCLDILGKNKKMKELLNEINKKYNVQLSYDCDNDDYLVPQIPQYNTNFMNEFIHRKNYKKIILFFNLKGYSGQENIFSNNFDNNFTQKLVNENPDSLIITIDKSALNDENLISLTDDVKIEKQHSGKSIVLYANICNLCDEVYFKNNGGSLFLLNKININNTKTKYFFINKNDNYYRTIKNSYKFNIELIDNFHKYN
jgi:hypothetical protein